MFEISAIFIDLIYVFYVFKGRKIAIDASMCLYQFLIAVRAEGAQLTSADGETTRYWIDSNKYVCILRLSPQEVGLAGNFKIPFS